MIDEDYVSFETAKLLKENGFVEPVRQYYNHEKKLSLMTSCLNWNKTELFYSLPTLQMAMKWLRQKYNLHIITLPYAPMDRHPYHPGEADMVYIAQLFRGIIPIDEIRRSVIKLTPEEACDAAIRYCLENLV